VRVTTQYLDNFLRDLTVFVEREGPAFEAKYGKNARQFLTPMPGVFQVLRRTSIDLEVPPEVRTKTALAALYLIEAHDFLSTPSGGPHGLIDDVWVAFRTFAFAANAVPDERMRQHWRGAGSFDDALALAHNVTSIEVLVPSRVLEMVKAYLDVRA
jgi:hypothetical protein